MFTKINLLIHKYLHQFYHFIQEIAHLIYLGAVALEGHGIYSMAGAALFIFAIINLATKTPIE